MYKKAKKKNWLLFEELLGEQGYKYVAGVDEVGRGPLAGPVVAAAVIFPLNLKVPEINDSKKLSTLKRAQLYQKILDSAGSVGWGICEVTEINKLNILQASLKAMQEAIFNLKISPDFVLVDGNQKIPHLKIPQKTIVKGDSQSQSIAAASIVAKVIRDEIMKTYHQMYPQFGFEQHKGYATKKHKEALKQFGPTPLHRLNFAPVKLSYLKSKEKSLGL